MAARPEEVTSPATSEVGSLSGAWAIGSSPGDQIQPLQVRDLGRQQPCIGVAAAGVDIAARGLARHHLASVLRVDEAEGGGLEDRHRVGEAAIVVLTQVVGDGGEAPGT
jgi:hypothetical protein